MRFLALLASCCLLIASTFLALVFGTATYAALEHCGRIPYFEYLPNGQVYLPLALSPARFATFQTTIWGLFTGSLLTTGLQLCAKRSRQQLSGLLAETRSAFNTLAATVRRLTAAERLVAGGLLAVIAGVQLFWLLTDSLSPDELVSFDAFVHEGPRTIASFYPIPNNHIFYNLASWVLAQLYGGNVRAIMRLPSFVAAVLGTAGSYVLLAHWCNFRIGTAVTALFSLSQLTIIYAASGRGYYLQMGCLQLAFFSVLAVLNGGHYQRLAWAVLVVSSVVGLYTIPTFALPLFALAMVLVAMVPSLQPSERGRFLKHAGLALGTIGVVTAVLYLPVGCVSGWPRLLTNRYVTSHSSGGFWAILPAYVYETTAMLLGPVRPALMLCVPGVAAVPFLLRRGSMGPQHATLAWASWTLVVTPLGLMLMGQILIPARVLLYVTYFLFLLAALTTDQAFTKWQSQPSRWIALAPAGLLVALLGHRIVGLAQQIPVLHQSQEQERAGNQAYQWLLAHPLGPVFMGASYYGLLFHHYALLDKQELFLHARHVPGVAYKYLVWAHGQPTTQPKWAEKLPYRVKYRDALTCIYALDTASSPH